MRRFEALTWFARAAAFQAGKVPKCAEAYHKSRAISKLALENCGGTGYVVAEAQDLRGLPYSGGVAQSVRVQACHAGGRGFESRHSRHSSESFA